MNDQNAEPAYGDYIIYVDESGDHSLTSIDPQYPIFVLAFCIVRKADLVDRIVPSFQRLKLDTFGHDAAVLHAHEIRKAKGIFRFLVNQEKREAFMARLNHAMGDAPFTLVASVIRKDKLTARYPFPHNPYDLALRFCMERAFRFLWDAGQRGKRTHLVVESRGGREDADLELEFRRVCQNAHRWMMQFHLAMTDMPFDIVFAGKKANSTGLQLADLAAHPIGAHVLDPDQPNRAFDLIEPKLLRKDDVMEGWGLKVFP